MSDVFPPLLTPSSTEGDSVTNFKKDLLQYVQAYKRPELTEWIKILQKHDMSSAK